MFFLYSMCPINVRFRDIYRCVSPPKCNYYPMSLQRSYFQNISGRTRNFPITVVSGLQLRWAPLPQAVFFASILLVALLKDVPSSADGLPSIFGRPAEGPGVLHSLFSSIIVLSRLRVSSAPGRRVAKAGILFARPWPWLYRTCRLVFTLLR